jgi:VanZ family protein
VTLFRPDPRPSARWPVRYAGLWTSIGWGLVATIVYLSLTPRAIQFTLAESDKLEHLVAYFVLAGWYCQLYVRRYHWVVALAAAALGVLMECLQGMTSYRTFEVMDMLADGAGVGLAVSASVGSGATLVLRADRRLASLLDGKSG